MTRERKKEKCRKQAPHDNSHETRLRKRRRRKKREQKRGIASQLRVNDLKGMSGISARGARPINNNNRFGYKYIYRRE
jgi:hypothetical protein